MTFKLSLVPLIVKPYEEGSATSIAAAEEKTDESLLNDEARVLAHLKSCGSDGATDDELEVALGMIHQNVSARRRGLVLQGYVSNSKRERFTRRARKAVVWIYDANAPTRAPLARREPHRDDITSFVEKVRVAVIVGGVRLDPNEEGVLDWLERKVAP